MASQAKERVCLVVVGDIGRSPRMRYHAESFSREGFHVDIVGYDETPPEFNLDSDITVIPLPKVPASVQMLPKLVGYVCKTLWLMIVLLYAVIVRVGRPKCYLVQNPPSVPVLPVVWLASKLRFSSFFIDWHNYGYTILSMALPHGHVLVRLNEAVEKFFGRWSNGGFCVTNAMKKDLSIRWAVTGVTVLYDRPPTQFKPLTLDEKHELFVMLSHVYPVFSANANDPNRTTFTCDGPDGVIDAPDRPRLIVSSTSWTEDEDFGVLLFALDLYEARRSSNNSALPCLVCVITGKGPEKARYVAEIKERQFKHIQVLTPWLPAQDYPRLLGAADLGVSLHTSSSGLDLPMKVVDMFGAGLPVLAADFPSLPELVTHGHTGLVFTTATQLCDQLCAVLRDDTKLDEMRRHVAHFRRNDWHSNWLQHVKPLVTR